MTTNLTTLQPQGATLPAAFQNQRPAQVFQGQQFESGADGIEGSYPIIKYAGKVWSIHMRGENRPFIRQDDGTPRGSIDVVFVRAAPNKAKTYYTKFVEGSKEKPICWSNDGVRPDAAVPQKQALSCALCPHNVFGSRITDDNKQAKECGDHKRAAVVLDPALAQSVFGAPLSEAALLRIPAASLNDFAVFSQTMEAQGFALPTFITRISFDITKNFPKLKFEALRPLSDEEGVIALALRDDAATRRIVSDAAGAGEVSGDVTVTSNSPAPTATAAQNNTPALQSGVVTNTPNATNVIPLTQTIQQTQVPAGGINITPPAPPPAPNPTPAQQAAAMQPEPGAPTTQGDALEADIDAKINALLG